MYSGDNLFTILNTSHAICFNLRTWSGCVFVDLRRSLIDHANLVKIRQLVHEILCTQAPFGSNLAVYVPQ